MDEGGRSPDASTGLFLRAQEDLHYIADTGASAAEIADQVFHS